MDRRALGGERQPWGWRGGATGAAPAGALSRLDRGVRRLRDLVDPSPVEAAGAGEPVPRAVRLRGSLNPPATPDAIAEAELRLGTALPADYSQFLLQCDGATLAADATVSGEPGIAAELLGTRALVRHAEAMEYDYHAWCIPELVIFATVGTEGDRLAFETGRMNPFGGCGVLDARHDYRPDQWWVIARDFTAWLDAVLKDPRAAGSFGRAWDDTSPAAQPELPFPDSEEPLPPNPSRTALDPI
jgi:SMI1/KNR4 family protein SUKH-1